MLALNVAPDASSSKTTLTTRSAEHAALKRPHARRTTTWQSLLSVTVLAAATAFTGLAQADEGEGGGAVRLLKTIPIPGTPLRGFDISWVDAATQTYYLADRSNAAVDVVDAKTGTYVKRLTGGFAGVKFNANNTANNALSGPNGVTSSGRWLFVTDAGSRVVTIDLTTGLVVSSVVTSPSPNRADELAYDSHDGTLLVINNADEPPFGTLISVNKSTGQLTVGAKIIFDAAHAGFNATSGAEQPVWDPEARKFYLSIPEINCTGPTCGGGGATGAVVQIDPHSTGHVDAVFPVQHCQPAGLTLGPKDHLLIGCGVPFDTAGVAWTATDAATAAPVSIVLNAHNGAVVATVAGVSGSDEVWYNRGDGNYYLAARNNPGGPVLGVIDAKTNTLTQLVPTINTAGKTTAPPFPSGTAHSVAANPHNNWVFVPLPANNVFPSCLNGCIAVYASPERHDD
ncbi:MAG: hypothetical protein JWN94_3866 [Betaproteobacteria bacterium]|nr:hypothetical protein [Betaproteobacteria bacterium]